VQVWPAIRQETIRQVRALNGSWSSSVPFDECGEKAQGAQMDIIRLTPDQLDYVRARAGQVDPRLADRFEKAYAAWKTTWKHPLIVTSSAPAARAQSVEFLDLIALGPDVLPLLMEKLTHPDEFFALLAVDRLAPPELQVSYELDDEAVLLGEQGRAIETVRRWVLTEA
jgi:hypothetical protein